ncbi:hypothetical protein B484DRAFT_417305, partial [Ochromonadaceae sp. CCMP2298]
MIVLALLRMLTLLLTVSSSSSRVEIVSIVDALSAPLCLLKIHSLLESSSSDLSFNFLLMDPSIADSWDSAFKATFPSAQYRNRLWSRPPSLVQSSNHTFDRDLIYARFYLPDIFPELQRFIYIDNDAIVTADLGHLYSMRLTPTTPTSLPGIGDHSSGGGVPRTHNHTGNAAAMKSKMLDRYTPVSTLIFLSLLTTHIIRPSLYTHIPAYTSIIQFTYTHTPLSIHIYTYLSLYTYTHICL